MQVVDGLFLYNNLGERLVEGYELGEKVSRRNYIKYAGAGVVVVAGAAAGAYYASTPGPQPTATTATATSSRMNFSGITSAFYTVAHPTTDAAKQLSKTFKEMTGLEVQYVEFDWAELNQKVMLELTGHTGAIDISVNDESQTEQFGPYAHDLRDFSDIADPKLLALDDLFEPIVKLLTTIKGKFIGIPNMNDSTYLSYRMDLFEDAQNQKDFQKQYGYELHPPTNGDELKDVAKFFQRPKDNMYGMCDSWAKAYLVMSAGSWLFGNGGKWFENWEKGDYTPTIDTDQMRKAMKDCIWFIENATPPDILSIDIPAVSQQMQTGRTAMGITWNTLTIELHKPDMTKYYDKFRYAVHPLSGVTGHMGWWITSDSKHPDAAYKLIEWICAPENQLTFVKLGGVPFRKSSMSNPDILAALAGGGPWASSIAEVGMKNLDTAWPRPHFVEYFGWEELANNWLARILTKSVSIDDGVKGLQKETEKFMKQYGYT